MHRYDKAQKGILTAEEFRQIWREGKSDEAKKLMTNGSAGITLVITDSSSKYWLSIHAYTCIYIYTLVHVYD